MSDQADTLRKMMVSRPLEGRLQEGKTEIIVFDSATSGAGRTTLVVNLAAILASAGMKVVISADKTTGSRMWRYFSHDGIGLGRENLWVEDCSAGVDGSFLCSHRSDLLLFDYNNCGYEKLLSENGACHRFVVVATPGRESLARTRLLIARVRRVAPATRIGVIVNFVTDSMEGRMVFQQLKQSVDRVGDVGLVYLGYCERDQKITESVLKCKFLIDLNTGTPSLRSLQLLAKRIGQGWLGIENDRRPLRGYFGRFREEPALGAPGKLAGFWKALLGEVKT